MLITVNNQKVNLTGKAGWTCGGIMMKTNWTLELTQTPTVEELQTIFSLISEGYTEGYQPFYWKISDEIMEYCEGEAL